MVPRRSLALALLVVGSVLTAWYSFSQTQSLLEAASQPGAGGDGAPLASGEAPAPGANRGRGDGAPLASGEADAPVAFEPLAQRQAAQPDAEEGALAAPAAPGAAAGAGGAAPPAAAEDAPIVAAGASFREDLRCGRLAPQLPGGGSVGCDPLGEFPCCSAGGWCGNTPDHCDCKGCQRHSLGASSGAQAGAVDRSVVPGRTVVVILPFRDREGHLAKFKEYWRWFAREGRSPPTVSRWEIYISEQFDSSAFNRGWTFNVAFAVATGLTHASPEIAPGQPVPFDCAVIQDIDYLPEAGVDYSDCKVPMQLSSEIDRFNGKVPYLESAGGIVGMSPEHWRKINGFGNNYFGWGGEDDELFHRLRINSLLRGDCYPFCTAGDKRQGKPGYSIKRPSKGRGVFSGKYMHSANHTKRITDSKAYERNLKQLEEIRRDHPRWRADGLQDLAFRILSTSVDTTDSATHGITYHHIKARRGRAAFDLRGVLLAVPADLCSPRGGGAWELQRLGDATPWDVASLRQRAAQPARLWDCPGAAGASFLLLDRRRGLAKVLADASPRLLVVFFRSLVDPAADGLIIADPRPVGDLLRAFEEAAALFRPAVAYSFCTARVKTGGLKYGVYQSAACGGDGWDSVDRASWLAFATPRPGLIPVTWCVNEKYWTQHIVQAERCPERWQDLDWKYGGTFWARAGERFCVGVRQAIPELSFSKLGIASSCAGSGGFSHAFGFDGVREETSLVPVSVCLGRGAKNRSRVSLNNNCGEDGFEHTGSFAARVGARALGSDEVFCVASGASGDAIFPAGGCGEQWRFDFALPPAAPADAELPREPASAQGITVCAAPHGPAFVSGGGGDCEGGLLLRTPSAAALAASVPRGRGGGEGPLFVLVEEAAPCASFLCPGVLQSRA